MLEAMVVVVIVGIVAAMAIPTVRAARRNATLSGKSFEVALWLDGLRTRALRDQRDLVAVIVDVPGNDPAPCARGDDRSCGRYVLVRRLPGFRLDAFDPSTPAGFANAELVDSEDLGRGVRFYRRADGFAAPRPFTAIAAFDPELVADCGGRACVGIRFGSDGTVAPEYPTGSGNPKVGVAIALAGDQDAETFAADHRGFVVSFPTGIVKSFPVPRL